MAIYHLSVKVVSRGKGHNAIAAGAYRSGEKLQDMQNNRTYNYSHLSDRVAHSEILTPENAPVEFTDRQLLYNKIEQSETRINSRLLREIEVALPREWNLEQQKERVQQFAKEQFVNLGMIADLSIHNDDKNHNPHAHILLTTREIDGNSFGKKNRDWNKKEMLTNWREAWQEKVNDYLDESDHIDHRTLQAQGILDRVPKKHYGKYAWNAMQNDIENGRPIESERATRLQQREAHYSEVEKFLEAGNLHFDADSIEQIALVRQLREQEFAREAEEMDKSLERYTPYTRLPQEQGRGIER